MAAMAPPWEKPMAPAMGSEVVVEGAAASSEEGVEEEEEEEEEERADLMLSATLSIPSSRKR